MMYGRERVQSRVRDFRKGIDGEDSRRKRQENSIRIRKSMREERLQKKRNIKMNYQEQIFISKKITDLPQMIADINCGVHKKEFEATMKFRKILSIEHDPPIQQVIDAGVVGRLVQFLERNDDSQLQFEAAWALTNIASGNPVQTAAVIDSEAVPIFVKLLSSPNDDVREQAVWALGNIAGDSHRCRDLVLSHGVMEPLLCNLIESSELTMLRNATWTLSNLCRGKPQPLWKLVKPALSTLARLTYSTDEDVLTDACWALSYLSDGPNDHIQAVIESGVMRRMVELLVHTSFSVQTSALRTVGNIVTGDDMQTQVVINVNVLPALLSLLSSPKKGIKKEACWTISNITAGTRSQIQAVIDATIIPPLIALLKNAPFDIKKEAAWAISNATSGGSAKQIRYLVSEDCIKPLCDLLDCVDHKIILVALEGMENILKVGEKDAKGSGVNEYAAVIEECDGLDKIENLQGHNKIEIYQKSVKILETYFAAEEEDIASIQPNTTPDASAFTFGTGSNIPSDFRF